MKLGPVIKLEKKNKTMSKKFENDVVSEFMTPLSFFQFMANLELSRGRIPDS